MMGGIGKLVADRLDEGMRRIGVRRMRDGGDESAPLNRLLHAMDSRGNRKPRRIGDAVLLRCLDREEAPTLCAMNAARRGIIALLAVAVTSGCSTTIAVERPISPNARAQIAEDGSGHRAQISHSDGAESAAYRLRVTDDALAVRGADSGPEVEIPLDDVDELRFVRHGKGALDGWGMGALVAIGFGVVVYAVEDDSGWFGRTDSAILATLGVSILTMPIGAAIGGAIGHRVTYVLDPR
ncbi:MAG: hypothetical protein AAF389_04960 [Gemmatimonadota bacterium]